MGEEVVKHSERDKKALDWAREVVRSMQHVEAESYEAEKREGGKVISLENDRHFGTVTVTISDPNAQRDAVEAAFTMPVFILNPAPGEEPGSAVGEERNA